MPAGASSTLVDGVVVGLVVSTVVAVVGFLAKDKLETIEDKLDKIEDEVEEEKVRREQEHSVTIMWLMRMTNEIEDVDEDDIVPEEVEPEYGIETQDDD